MDHPGTIAVYTALLLAGLAGSLHCAGMCGPILAGFTTAFNSVNLTVGGRATAAMPRPRRLWLDMLGYHAGRLWTYAMLGLFAGAVGDKLRQGSALVGWQRPAALVAAAAVIVTGLVMLRAIPKLTAWLVPGRRVRLPSLECSSQKFAGARWLSPLVRGTGMPRRMVLGAIMGLLPCGLLYSMLTLVATLPHPLLSAAGMLIFGLGTLPALSAVVFAAARLPMRWRSAGIPLAASVMILTGGFMLARALLVEPDSATCIACPTTASR